MVHNLPEAEKFFGHGGLPLQPIGSEISEQLDYIPTRVRVLKHIRLKYACPGCDQHWMWVRLGGPPGQPMLLFNHDPSRDTAVPKRLRNYRLYHVRIENESQNNSPVHNV